MHNVYWMPTRSKNMRFGYRHIGLLLFFITVNGAGSPTLSQEVAMECQWETFKSLNETNRYRVFDLCNAEQQVELFVKWTFSTYPPNFELSEPLASRGRDVLPALVERIEKVGTFAEDGPKPELVHVLLLMQIRGYYAVTNDIVLMERVGSAINRIRYELLKSYATEVLNDLKKASRKGTP